jgi:tetratricopeptide (TPR) repeat protein
MKGEDNAIVRAVLAPSTDPATRYENRHEAAIAALKAANQIVSLGGNGDRVIYLLLIAAKRDPHFGTVLYDLGLICAKGERWDDAIRFYQRVPQVDSDQEVARLAEAELERVELLAKLESTTDGQHRRQFDSEFVVITKSAGRDAVHALESLKRLAALDGTRWEVPALRGVLEASLGDYAASSLALENASQLAPADRRVALRSAAERARLEATYVDSRNKAQLEWEKPDYEEAAKLYSLAWETSPGRSEVGMKAAVAFLMADDIAPAVQTLTRILQTGSPENASKARAMLTELRTISQDAARAAAMEQNGVPEVTLVEVTDHIRKLVGDLTSPQMLLTAKAPPPFLQDNTPFIRISDSEVDSQNAPSFLSTDSVFARYEGVVAGVAPTPAEAASPATGTGPTPVANPPVETPPAQAPVRSVALSSPPDSPAPKPARGPDHGFAITSQPVGATVVFDNDPSTTCRTPCQLTAASGRHTLVAMLNGYRDIKKIVNIEKNGATLPMELAFERRQGSIEVTGGAPGSRIYLDGNKTDQTTPGILIVPEGDHEIGLEANNEMLKRTVHVHDDDWLRIKF